VTATTKPPTPARREPRGWADFDRLAQARTEDRFTIGSALLLTLLLHGAVLSWIPWSGRALIVERPKPAPTAPPPQLEYALAPATPEDIQAMRYVDANPDAPATTAPNTNNFAARDERAAQPNPVPNQQADRPHSVGDIDYSPTIVKGDLRQPAPPQNPSPPGTPQPSAPSPKAAPPTPPSQAEPAPQKPAPPTQSAKAAQASAPSTPPDALPGEPGNGEGVREMEKPVDSPSDAPVEMASEQAMAAPPPSVAALQDQAMQPVTPTPPPTPGANAAPARTRVQIHVTSGILMDSSPNVGTAGIEAVDAKFSKYGEYLSRMFEAICSDWYTECDKFNFSTADYGAKVEIAFVIDPQGQITDLRVLRSNASQAATLLCVNAVQSRAPFGDWTKEMAAQLGAAQTIRISFWYQ
jgi:hypothetical protein